MKDEIINDILRDMEADAEAAWEGTSLRRALVKYATRLRKALDAPARNCDRYATVEDAKRTYIAERGHVFIWDGDSSERFERWLFAPAEGGAE